MRNKNNDSESPTLEEELKNLGPNAMEETRESCEPEIQVVLSRPIRLIIFSLFIIKEILVDIDSGIIASSSMKIRQTLKINDSQYGIFASIPFTGRLIGAFIFIFLFNNDHRKLWLILSSLIHGSLLCMYFLTSNYFLLLIVRILTAIVKSFSTIYLPIWIDQFGIRQYKTILLTILHMTNPYGNVIGFSLGGLVFKDWRNGLFSAGSLVALVGFSFILFPQKYFSNKYMFIGYDEEKLVPTKTEKRKKKKHKKNMAEIRKHSLFSDLDMSLLSFEGKKEVEKKGTIKVGISLLRNGSFVFSSLSRSVLFFVLQIIHLFFKEYTDSVLKVKDNNKIVLYYSFISLIAPATGSLIGGVFSNYLGGYESPNSSTSVSLFSISAGLAAFILGFTENFSFFSVGMFMFFFSVSGILPTITGYTLLSSPRHLKSIASSLDLLITTLTGKLPGPIIYGTLNDKFGEEGNSFAWKTCMIYYYFGMAYIFISCKLVKEKMKERRQEETEKNISLAKSIRKGSKFLSEVACADRIDLVRIGKPQPDE